MQLLGLELTIRRKAAQPLRPLASGRDGGWFPLIVREPYTGAWQANAELRADSYLSNATVFACVTRIASDISKLPLRLVERDGEVWTPTTNPAYTPVLRKPNHYQTIVKFIEQWVHSRLIWGNAYILKRRDLRGVVDALYPLNPQYVTPLVATDGAVFYQLKRHDVDLAGLRLQGVDDTGAITVPAREIIHDRLNCLFHPLVGVPPLFAAGVSAALGSTILSTSTQFFSKESRPSGVLSSDQDIPKEKAAEFSANWQTLFTGANRFNVAILGRGLKYDPIDRSASESQLVDQYTWTEVDICKCFGMPLAMLNTSKGAPYGNNEQLVLQYHDGCLQTHLVSIETSLDEGLEFPLSSRLGTEFDIDDLIWMDTATRTKAASDAIRCGALSPNEARLKYFGLGPVAGGDTPYMQQQMFSLAALAERDSMQPFSKPTPAPPALPAEAPPEGEAA